MVDEANRDKYKLKIVRVCADVAKNEKNATSQQVEIWHDQLEKAWEAFKESHTNLMDRAGASEHPVHESIFNATQTERNDLRTRKACRTVQIGSVGEGNECRFCWCYIKIVI